MYHNIDDDPSDPWSVSPGVFTAQMQWLSAYPHSVLSLEQAVINPGSSVHRKDVVLTFDDGYADFYEYALPRLEQYGFAATLFVVAGKVGSMSSWRKGELRKPLLDWAGLRDVVRRGISIGSHGLHHLDLTTLNSDELLAEVDVSRKVLEDKLGISVKAFSYPWGRCGAREIGAVEKAGYRCAVLAGGRGGNSKGTNRFELKRETMRRGETMAEFEARLGGRRIARWGRRIMRRM